MFPVDTCAEAGGATRARTARAHKRPFVHVFIRYSFSDGLISRGPEVGGPRTHRDAGWGVRAVRRTDRAGGASREMQAPLVHPPDDGLQGLPEGREAVFRPTEAVAHDASRDESGPLHLAEPRPERLPGDPGDPAHQVAERSRAPEELPHEVGLVAVPD